MRIRIMITVLVVCLLAIGSMAYAADKDKLIGVWQIVSTKSLETGETNTSPRPAHIIFAKKYFSYIAADADRKKIDKPADEKTREELLDMNKFAARFCSYTVAGNKGTTRRLQAKNPNIEGTENAWDFRFDGEHLIIKTTSSELVSV